MGNFVHLHLHSEYSLLDGACRIKDIPERVLECGHDAVAITDHGVMYGAVEFYNSCKSKGVKPIIGCEVYVAPRSRFDKVGGKDGQYYHLVLLCKNDIGYKNLIYMVSKGFTEGFYNKPRIDLQLLKSHSKGLIALSACLAGQIPQLLLKGFRNESKEAALELSEIFGKDNFYIELQNHGIEEQIQILPELISLANECNLPLVATNDCHYLRKSDADTQATLICIKTNNCVTDGRPLGFEGNEFYYKSTEEMKVLFGQYEEAVENTVKIANRCNFDFDFSKLFLPKFPCPNGIPAKDYLRSLAENGLELRMNNGDISNHISKDIYLERIDYELKVIEQKGYSDYFLIVQDYVNFAKCKDIPVGPGRGSGASSLVAFCVGITDIDPIEYGLLFEIFLNPERISMPDIDIDFCYTRRQEVIDYVTQKYGEDRVSQIVTFGTLATKAAIRDTGRALGIQYNEIDSIVKSIPQEQNITISNAMHQKALKDRYNSDWKIRKLIDTSASIEGMPRNVSIHAAGVVITEQPIFNYVPMAMSSGTTITQYDMDTIAKIGLLKFDFLGLRYLTVINDAQNIIRKRESNFDIRRIDLKDSKSFELIASGATLGLFQLESEGMRQMLVAMRPMQLSDIIAAIALYRPGPMDFIPKFIENRNNPQKAKYIHPILESILSPTYGCIVYQEQVVNIFREVAGYTYGHADVVQRAMSKKKTDVMESERNCFISGSANIGMSEEDANNLFDSMSSFSKYAFKKSHAAAYALISYRTAYLKAHYPAEYFAALLTSVFGNTDKMASYIAECGRCGINVSSPDINLSFSDFSVSDNKILFGFSGLKNIGRQLAENIVSERTYGRFTSFDDFVFRMSKFNINKKQIDVLIKSGAFDCLGVTRSSLLIVFEQILDIAAERKRRNISGQLDMFSLPEAIDAPPAIKYPPTPELDLPIKLRFEKESTGMYFSGQVLDDFTEHLKYFNTIPLSSIVSQVRETDEELSKTKLYDGMQVSVVGTVSSIQVKQTKNENEMMFFDIEDQYYTIECIAFPNVFLDAKRIVFLDVSMVVDGKLQIRDGEPIRLIASKIHQLISNKDKDEISKIYLETKLNSDAKMTKAVSYSNAQRLFLRVPDRQSQKFNKCVNLIEIFEGMTPVTFYNAAAKEYKTYHIGVNLSKVVVAEFTEILGKENVVLK